MTSATPAPSTRPTPSGDDVALDPRIARSRARLLDAATDLLVESGPRAVTADAVAERSGVSKSTMYRHWSSRQELLVDVVRSNMPHVAPPDPSLGFADGVVALVTTIASELSDPRWQRILPAMMSLRHQLPELAALTESDHQEKRRVLEEVLGRGVAEGAIPADLDVELVSQVLIGPIVFAMLIGEQRLEQVARYSADRFLAAHGASAH